VRLFSFTLEKEISAMTLPDGTTPQAPTEQPAPSAPQGGDSSQAVVITKAEWDRVNSLLGRIQDLQGGRDIARQTKEQVAQLDGQVRSLLERAHLLGSQNKPLNEALNQIQSEQSDEDFRKAVFEIAQSLRGGAQPTGTGNAQGVDVAPVFAEYGLDPKDPFVAGKLAGITFASKEQAELAAGRILKEKTLAPPTNLSQQSATPGGGEPVKPIDSDALLVEKKALMKNPTSNYARLQEINQALSTAE
jgi:hypothetical protein